MKKKITTFTKAMLFCLIVVLSSCEKEEVDIANPLLKNYQNSFIKEDFSKIIKTDFEVDWNSMKKGVSDDLKAEVYEFDIRTTLMVPSIPNHKSIYYKLIAFEKEGKQEFHIAKFADDPNNRAVSPSFLDPVNYSGKIYLLNPSGQMEFAKKYQNGLFTGYMNVSNENPSITGRMALYCEIFIVTHYTNYWVIVGNFWNYTTLYSYTSYETICSEGGGAPAQTVRNSAYNYTTYISTDYAGKTKLFIAASIFHEMVHAYFMSLFDDYYNANPPNLNAYNDFAGLFHHYVTLRNPDSVNAADVHHQQMATDYVDAIARALQEYQTGIPVPIGTSPNQIYSDLAWGGLSEAPVFDVLFPVGSSAAQRIKNRYASEQTGHTIGQGTLQEQTQIGQPCN